MVFNGFIYMPNKELTDKQKRFIDEYLVDSNATQAAIRAGYSEKNADKIGPELLGKTRVAEEVKARQDELAKTAGLSHQWVLENLKAVAKRCMQAEPVLDNEGNETGEYTFAHAGANKALELIGKHLGMFINKHQLLDENGKAFKPVTISMTQQEASQAYLDNLK